MASSKSLPGVRMVTPTGRPATRSSSGSSTANRSRARRASPPGPTFSTRRSATPRPAIAASQAPPFPLLPSVRPARLARPPRPGAGPVTPRGGSGEADAGGDPVGAEEHRVAVVDLDRTAQLQRLGAHAG